MEWTYGDDAAFRIQVAHVALYQVLDAKDPAEAQEAAQDVAAALSLAAESLESGFPQRAEILQVADEARDLGNALGYLQAGPFDRAFWAALTGFINWLGSLEHRLGGHLFTPTAPSGASIH
jgi:hypothetical protein